MMSFRTLSKYAPVLLLIMFMIATTSTILPAEAQYYPVPPWITPKNSCILFQTVYNRTYWTPRTEMGQTTDFNDMIDCVRWCMWTQGCVGVLMVEKIYTAYGGCYDIQGPCCKIFSVVTPDWDPMVGVPYSGPNGKQHTSIIRYWPPPFPYDLECPVTDGYIDMGLHAPPPVIWYDNYLYAWPYPHGEADLVAPSNPEESMMSSSIEESSMSSSSQRSISPEESAAIDAGDTTNQWFSRAGQAS